MGDIGEMIMRYLVAEYFKIRGKYKVKDLSAVYMVLLIILNTPYLFYQIVSGFKLHSLVVLERNSKIIQCI